jgi:hypothetical protein
LDYSLSDGQTVLREKTTCDDNSPCILLIIVNDGNIIRRVWINRVTGQQVKLQTAQKIPDGTEIILYTQTFLPVEQMDAPPQEVLDLLAKVLFSAP